MNTGKSLGLFGHDLLVHCPRCRQCANVHFHPLGSPGSDRSVERTCACIHCGYSDQRPVSSLPAYSYRTDWHRRLDLWLQITCFGHILWALNEKHLAFLDHYVSAKLRERRPDEKWGWTNAALAGRLPRWITSGKNCEEVLQCIHKLKLRLP